MGENPNEILRKQAMDMLDRIRNGVVEFHRKSMEDKTQVNAVSNVTRPEEQLLIDWQQKSQALEEEIHLLLKRNGELATALAECRLQ